MAQVTRTSWSRSLLVSLGFPQSAQNLKILIGWQEEEGGAGPQFGVVGNVADYNPLNTTQLEDGATSVNSDGVKSYSSWSQGLKATATTLNNGKYTSILDMFNDGNYSASRAAAVINGSPWGTKGLTAALIQEADVQTGGLTVPTVKVGTVAGLGGTGTTANSTNAATFYVGDSTNPDMDYWSCINQYTQEAQWYCFSDGETLYVADGTLLMAQTPALVIHRKDPKVVSLETTHDTTSYGYAVNHKAKTGMQRRATLQRATGPTQATLKVICDIDDYRGGDVVYLLGCGPDNGLWLVTQCQRSIFQPYSELTLAPGMMPLSAETGLSIGPTLATSKNASKASSGTVMAAILAEATALDADNYRYVWDGGHSRAGYASVGSQGGPGYNGVTQGFDCSGAVGAVLAAAGVGISWGGAVPGDAGIIQTLKNADLILGGQGTGRPEVTLFDKSGYHIYMRINGEYWGTSAGGHTPSNGYGVGWVKDGSPEAGFTAYHIKPTILRSYITGSKANEGVGNG